MGFVTFAAQTAHVRSKACRVVQHAPVGGVSAWQQAIRGPMILGRGRKHYGQQSNPTQAREGEPVSTQWVGAEQREEPVRG